MQHQTGTVDNTPISARLVRALELSATAVILMHNHPGEDPTPSRADIEMTVALRITLSSLARQTSTDGLDLPDKVANWSIQGGPVAEYHGDIAPQSRHGDPQRL